MEDYRKITDDIVQSNQAIIEENQHLKSQIVHKHYKIDSKVI